MSKSTAYPLVHPIVVNRGKDNEQEITELQLREPTARDMRALPIQTSDQTWDHQFQVLASLTSQPMRVIYDMHTEDAIALVELVQKKLQPGP